MNRTKIEYLDYTWNPIVGCSAIGCAVGLKRCWACRQAKRHINCEACVSFAPHVHFERFDQPLDVKKSARIGTAFMGEFYDKEIDLSVQAEIYMRMIQAPWHQFIVFTKQPQNIDEDAIEGLKNLSIGVSVNNALDLWRINAIRNLPVGCRIVSAEPLYARLSMDLSNIDLLIIGAQTRPTVQPVPAWVQDLIICARQYGTKVFLKNNLSPIVDVERYRELPEQLCISPFEKGHHCLEVRSK